MSYVNGASVIMKSEIWEKPHLLTFRKTFKLLLVVAQMKSCPKYFTEQYLTCAQDNFIDSWHLYLHGFLHCNFRAPVKRSKMAVIVGCANMTVFMRMQICCNFILKICF